MVGIRDGYDGLMFPDLYPDGGLMDLTVGRVENIAHLGGTVLGTTNRGNPFRLLEKFAGGTPTSQDRTLGLKFGAGAVYALREGMDGVMVALNPPKLDFVPLAHAVAELKLVPPDCEAVLISKALGICFGELRQYVPAVAWLPAARQTRYAPM